MAARMLISVAQRKQAWLLPVLVFLLAGASIAAQAANDETILISRQSAADGGAGANDSSVDPSVSADGRYVAFESTADNLSRSDKNAFSNVFVRDTRTNTTTLVSRRGAADGGAGANGNSYAPSISADGRYVAFESGANSLSRVDDGYLDIFIRDTKAKTTRLVSRQSATDGGAGADYTSSEPSISADGRYVAFSSDARNLSRYDNDGSDLHRFTLSNVFVRDTKKNTTRLVSRQSATAGGAGANSISSGPSISADGRYVAFSSHANNLSALDNNAVWNVFVRDTRTDTTTLVSRRDAADGGPSANGTSFQPSISADGRYVAFRSRAANLSPSDNIRSSNIFVRDTKTKTTTLISRQSGADGGAAASGGSYEPSISADGRYIAFRSYARNLSRPDNNGFTLSSVFVRNTKTNTTTLVNLIQSVEGRTPGASEDAISADGRHVAFTVVYPASLGFGLTNVFLRTIGTGTR